MKLIKILVIAQVFSILSQIQAQELKFQPIGKPEKIKIDSKFKKLHTPKNKCSVEIEEVLKKLAYTQELLSNSEANFNQCIAEQGNYQAQLNSCQSDVASLTEAYVSIKDELTNLNGDYGVIIAANETLQGEVTALTEENSNLSGQIVDLTLVVNNLSTEVQSLSVENAALSVSYNELNTSHDLLKTQYESAINNLNITQTERDSLANNYQQLLDDEAANEVKLNEYKKVFNPETPYFITGNMECINAARSLLKKFIMKRKAGETKIKITRKARKTLAKCQANEIANGSVLNTLKNQGINIQ
ncbi:MAG: hypothetical protein SGJ02_13950 [bacterium]|nr:hypothetical protein [bacterium]